MAYVPPVQILMLAAVVALLSHVLRQQKKTSVMNYLPSWPAQKRASPESQSPPLRVTDPDKKPPATPQNTLPASTRPNLAKAAESLPTSQKTMLGMAIEARQADLQGALLHNSPEEFFMRNLMPFEKDWRTCSGDSFTPTGVTIDEIRTLGDFPSYEVLSGVPAPAAYKGFEIEKAIARPYRPFRWRYHQTMSLSTLQPDWWLELEKTYVKMIHEREELFAKHGSLVLQHLPGSDFECKEIMEVALQFLCARYPHYFSLSYSDSKDSHVFHNGILKNETVIKSMHPLHVLLHNVPEDFAVMIRNPEDGMYYLRAGIICSSLGWNLGTKIGKQLGEVHAPIPDYKEKMSYSMDRYFSKMSTSSPIQRGSWGLEIDTPLFMPPGDPHEAHRSARLPAEQLPLSRIHLRVDWQTLRRLPLSGAIIFNFKALFTPIEEFPDEPGVPGIVAKVLREGNKEIMEYKNTWHVEHVALPALEAWDREQREKGVVEKGWEVETLAETPFFRGWEGKWRRQQGF